MSVTHFSGTEALGSPRLGLSSIAGPLDLNPKSRLRDLPPSFESLGGDIDGPGAGLPGSVQRLAILPSDGAESRNGSDAMAIPQPTPDFSILTMLALLFSDDAMQQPGNQSEKYGKPSADDKRPPGDNRSAEQIIEDNPVLKNLGDQKDINREGLKKQCGDWENDPDPQKRADAAYKVSKVLNYIDTSKNREGGEREDKVTNGVGDGNIEGITSDGDARHGTEAGLVKDFSEQGYSALPDDHQLTSTNDSHVRLNGSNMDNLQWGCQQAANYIGFLPVIGGVLKGVGESEDGILNGLMGGVSGAASEIL